MEITEKKILKIIPDDIELYRYVTNIEKDSLSIQLIVHWQIDTDKYSYAFGFAVKLWEGMEFIQIQHQTYNLMLRINEYFATYLAHEDRIDDVFITTETLSKIGNYILTVEGDPR